MQKIFFLLYTLLFLNQLHASEQNDTLRFGYHIPSMNNVNGKDLKISLDFWAKELGERVHMKLINFYYKDIEKLKKDIQDKKIDLVAASSLVLATEFPPGTFKNGFCLISNDQMSRNKMVLLVAKDTAFKSLKDLKNKKIARMKNSDLEALYFNVELQKLAKQNADTFFKKNIFVKQHSKAVLKLFFKKVDAAFVTESSFKLAAELNPQIYKRLKVIMEIDIESIGLSLFTSNISDKMIKRFQKPALKMHESPRGRQLLTVFKADRLAESHAKDLEKIRKLYKEYLVLKN